MIKDGRACLENRFGHLSQFCIYIHRYFARTCALQMFILDRLVSYSPIWRHTSEELVWVHMARCALPAMSSSIWLKYRGGAAHLLEWWVLSRRYKDDGHGFDDTLVVCTHRAVYTHGWERCPGAAQLISWNCWCREIELHVRATERHCSWPWERAYSAYTLHDVDDTRADESS